MLGKGWTLGLMKAVAGLVAIVVIVAWMSGLFWERVAPGTVPVEAGEHYEGPSALVEAATQPVLEQAVGTVQAARRSAVASEILAQVLAIRVNAGDAVQVGDILVELDARDLDARLAQARQAAEGAKATMDKANADLERAQKLFTAGNLARSELDAARSASDVARAAYEQAQRAVEQSQVGRAKAIIKSPVAGRVVDRLAEPGDTVTPGQPLLNIYDPSALRLEVPVRESLATRLGPGQSVTVRIDALEEQLTGHIDEIVPQAEAGARTFLVKVVLPQHDRLYTGMFGRLLIPTGERSRLLVPPQAVEQVGQLLFVTVLDDRNIPQRRMVTIGPQTEDGRVEVLSGLAAGERVMLRAV